MLETLLLIFNDRVFHSTFYIFDPDLGFRVRPSAPYGTDRANEFGFNDRDYPHARRPGTYRILFLGDSFSWMGGLERNYTSILEKKFSGEFGPGRVEVINAGYSQTHTGEQLVLLKKFGLLYEPDLVVLSVFAGNDFYDADPRRKRLAVGGGMTDVFSGRDFYTMVFGQPVVLKSRLLLYLREKWQSLAKTLPEDAKGARKGSVQPHKQEQLRTGIRTISDDYLHSLYLRTQFNRLDRSREFEPNVTLICESIRDMKALLEERNVDFAVAVFPDEIQIDPELRMTFLEHYELDPSCFVWNRAQSILRRLCAKEEVMFLDLDPVFLEATGSGHRQYLPDNGHWNDSGNELAARFFFSSLKAKVISRLTSRKQ